jgi:NCS1 family nucleobase:cation symporter-1
VVTLAILGFRKLAQFAEVCSPWMFLMFIAGAFALFPAILASMPEVKSVGSFFEFWNVADAKIWPGPQPGQEDALGFLHIVSFAWICNLAMHVGLSDMALLRYARRASYGFYSAFGMYLGHYLAWICAGIMGAGAATIIGKPLAALDSGSVAYTALGVTGALAVVIAGWTTANPTIYRAGLALQVVTPNWPRWLVTLFAGAVTTVVACSPFVFTKLLDFVGLYGLLLMPVGAIVFVEHWIFPRIGFTKYWISRRQDWLKWVNLPGLIAWFVSLSAAVVVWLTGMLHLFFLLIPVWFVTAVLYIVLCYMCGARRKAGEPVGQAEADEIIATDSAGKPQPSRVSGAYHTWGVLALAALVGGLVIAIMVARAPADIYEARLKFFKQAIACLTVVYFVTAIVWMTAKEKGGDKN